MLQEQNSKFSTATVLSHSNHNHNHKQNTTQEHDKEFTSTKCFKLIGFFQIIEISLQWHSCHYRIYTVNLQVQVSKVKVGVRVTLSSLRPKGILKWHSIKHNMNGYSSKDVSCEHGCSMSSYEGLLKRNLRKIIQGLLKRVTLQES